MKLIPNTAMIFVSHSMPLVSRICNEIILMDKGQVKFQGEHVAKFLVFSESESKVFFDNYQDFKLLLWKREE